MLNKKKLPDGFGVLIVVILISLTKQMNGQIISAFLSETDDICFFSKHFKKKSVNSNPAVLLWRPLLVGNHCFKSTS